MLESPPALFTESKAVTLAAKLNADESDDWTYRTKSPPSGTGGYWKVAIFDESRDFVGFM